MSSEAARAVDIVVTGSWPREVPLYGIYEYTVSVLVEDRHVGGLKAFVVESDTATPYDLDDYSHELQLIGHAVLHDDESVLGVGLGAHLRARRLPPVELAPPRRHGRPLESQSELEPG